MKKIIMILQFVLLCGCGQSNSSGQTPPKAEGVVNGGGGKGVLCKNSNSIEVLDLYEAKIYGLEIESSSGSYEGDLRFGLGRLTQHLHWGNKADAGDIELALQYVKKIFKETVTFLPSGSRLKKTEDSFDPIITEGCDVVQIAVYYNEERIIIDKDYWDRLSPMNQVALFMHEIIYKLDRDYGATDSRESRKFVGRLFSKTPLPPLSYGIPYEKGNLTRCVGGIAGETPHFDFVVYEQMQNGKNELVLQFFQIGGKRVLGLTRASMPITSIKHASFTVSIKSDDSRINGWYLSSEYTHGNNVAIKMRLLRKDQSPDSSKITNVFCDEE